VNTVWGFGALLRWMSGSLSLCIVLIVGRRMRVDKEDILYLCMIPLIVMFLLGFYLFIGFVIIGVLGITGCILLWENIKVIDFGFNFTIRSKK
jgi:hypothetical protein